MINPDYLKTFLALIETKSFTRTAALLNMTQPGVSQHIQKLEEHFKADLISRQGKSFTITEAGKKLVVYSQSMFADYEQMKSMIGVDDPFIGVCKYASPGSFGLMLVDSLIEVMKKHSELSTSFTVAPNNSISSMLMNRDIDVGFMTSKPEDVSLTSSKFMEEELLLIVPKGVRILKFSDLARLTFINHPDGYFLAERLLKVNFENDVQSLKSISNRMFINQINRILDPVAQGLGFTVLPEGAFNNHPENHRLTAVKLKVRVFDEIYKVTRSNEILPARYATVEAILRRKK